MHLQSIKFLVLFLAFGSFPQFVFAVWEKAHHQPNASSIYLDLAWNGKRYVAVGGDGSVLISDDAELWIPVDSTTRSTLHRISFGEGKFVAVGYAGAVISSTDGQQWFNHAVNTDLSLNDVAYGDGRFVAVGEDGLILTSDNGMDWVQQTSPAPGASLEAIAWNGSYFLAVGQWGTIIKSTDGHSWTKEGNLTDKLLRDISWGDGRFIVAGDTDVYSSATGSGWNIRNVDRSSPFVSLGVWSRAYWTGDRYLAREDSGENYQSFDGVNWESQPYSYDFGAVINHEYLVLETELAGHTGFKQAVVAEDMQAIKLIEANGLFVVICENGVIKTSQDRISWHYVNTGIREDLTDIVWNGSDFVVVGKAGTILHSSDGLDWQIQTTDYTFTINTVSWGAGLFVATTAGQYSVLTSPNGIDWTTHTDITQVMPKSIIRGPAEFIGISQDNTILRSEDGLQWTTVSNQTTALNGLTWDGQRYIVVGDAGLVLTSPDGYVWETVDIGLTMDLYSIAWLGGKYFLWGGQTANGILSTYLNISTELGNWSVADLYTKPSWFVYSGQQYVG